MSEAVVTWDPSPCRLLRGWNRGRHRAQSRETGVLATPGAKLFLPFVQLFTASLTPHFNCQESFNLSAKKTNWEIFETSPGGILKSMSSSCVSLGIDILIFKKYIAKEVDTVPLNKPKYQAIRPQLSKLLAHLFNRMLGSYKNDDVDLNLLKCVHSNFGWKKKSRFQSSVYNKIPLLFFKIFAYRYTCITETDKYT